MRDVPKPVIARVNGFAIGGGNVFVTVSDLAIASEKAVFGQVGPRSARSIRLRHRLPGTPRRGEEGAGNLVALSEFCVGFNQGLRRGWFVES